MYRSAIGHIMTSIHSPCNQLVYEGDDSVCPKLFSDLHIVLTGVTLQVFMDLSPQEYQQLGGQGSFIEAVASYLSISTESIHPIGPAEASTIVVATGRCGDFNHF